MNEGRRIILEYLIYHLLTGIDLIIKLTLKALYTPTPAIIDLIRRYELEWR